MTEWVLVIALLAHFDCDQADARARAYCLSDMKVARFALTYPTQEACNAVGIEAVAGQIVRGQYAVHHCVKR